MKKFLFPVLAVAVVSAAALYSCSGGGSAGVVGVGSGTVGLYLTDDMSVYSQVTATVNRVQLVSTGTGTGCELLGAPVSVNIANMAGVMQLVDVTQCPAGPYNRFHIEFDQGVQLLESGATGTPTFCRFTDYNTQGMGAQPNKLSCDADGICSLDVTGAVNVLAQQPGKMALDFDLKNFDVSGYGTAGCSVTMKVSPLTPKEMHGLESVTGLVSNVDTTAMTFDLVRGKRIFNVLYAGISDTAQPGLGSLLQTAQNEGLRTQVTASTIDLSTNSITASRIEVKREGIISGLTGTTFTLNSGKAETMVVEYGDAGVSGTLQNGSWVQVKLIGLDGTSVDFIADKVEVDLGTSTEN